MEVPKVETWTIVRENAIDNLLQILDLASRYFRRYDYRKSNFLNFPKIVCQIGRVSK